MIKTHDSVSYKYKRDSRSKSKCARCTSYTEYRSIAIIRDENCASARNALETRELRERSGCAIC